MGRPSLASMIDTDPFTIKAEDVRRRIAELTCPARDECEYAQRPCGCGWAHLQGGEPMFLDCPHLPSQENNEIQETPCKTPQQ